MLISTVITQHFSKDDKVPNTQTHGLARWKDHIHTNTQKPNFGTWNRYDSISWHCHQSPQIGPVKGSRIPYSRSGKIPSHPPGTHMHQACACYSMLLYSCPHLLQEIKHLPMKGNISQNKWDVTVKTKHVVHWRVVAIMSWCQVKFFSDS